MDNPSVSVVVAVFNGAKTIAQTLKAISNQNYSHPYEVIVVDDGSTDATATILKQFPQVKYFYQSNQGPAVARNQGASLAAGAFIFFTDSDCVPQSDWIAKGAAHFKDPTVAVVAGSYGIANPEFILARVIHDEIIFRHRELMPVYPKVFGSYNFGVRKKIFKEVGGFDTTYRYPSGEDNDLSYKIIKAGHKIYFEKESRVEHFHTTRLMKYLKEQWRHGFWRIKMYVDHPQMSLGDDYTFWKDILEIPLALLFSLCLLVSLILKSKIIFGLTLIPLIILFLIEFYYALKITKEIKEIIYLSQVMSLRACARSAGFSSGILNLLFPKKSCKKKRINHCKQKAL